MQLTSVHLALAWVVLFIFLHSLNGDSLSFLRDLGMYLKIDSTEPIVIAAFLPFCLIKEGVFSCLLSYFLSYCLGTPSFSTWREFFVPPLPIDALVNGMIFLGASSFSKNLASTKWTQPCWMTWHCHLPCFLYPDNIYHIVQSGSYNHIMMPWPPK